MEIFVKKTDGPARDRHENKKIGKAKVKKSNERRKEDRDRRRSVNEGVLVHLSTKEDRREGRERRSSHAEPDTSVKFDIEVDKEKRLFCAIV